MKFPGPVPEGSFWGVLGGFGEFDVESEFVELGDELAFASFGLVFAGEVVGAEFGVGGLLGEEMPADHQDRVGYSDECSLFAAASCDPVEPDSEVAIFGPYR